VTDTEALGADSPEARPAIQREIVVIGASAGGVEALGKLVERLPPELPAAVFVVLHVLPGGTSVLPQILDRKSRIQAAAAIDGETVERGRIYVAPPDHHMLVADGRVHLTRGPRENGRRPAVDPLFRSAAREYGQRTIGVVLSGALDDGTAGLRMISDRGGATLVQEPGEALYPSMPSSALAHDPSAKAVPIADMADVVCAMIDEELEPEEEPVTQQDNQDLEHPDRSDTDPRSGELTELTCPECGGSLWEHENGGVVRFKCHVGHAYSSDSLELSQAQALESALWAGLRSLQERASFYRRLARRSGGTRVEEKAADAERHAAVLRELVMSAGRETEAGEAGSAA